MSVTKEQAEMFWHTTNTVIENPLQVVEAHVMETAIVIASKMLGESQAGIDSLTEQLSSQISNNTKEVQAKAVMDFVSLQVESFNAGFLSKNWCSLLEQHNCAVAHVKDSYGVVVPNITDEEDIDALRAKETRLRVKELEGKNKKLREGLVAIMEQSKVGFYICENCNHWRCRCTEYIFCPADTVINRPTD